MQLKKADRELLRQLDAAPAGGPVEVVISLRADPSLAELPSAKETEEQVARLLERVGQETGEQPRDHTVFGNLGAFAVSAPAGFVRQLMRQPEVATATANRQPEDLPIRPVGPRRGGGRKKEGDGTEDRAKG